jgi:hypothetical protein
LRTSECARRSYTENGMLIEPIEAVTMEIIESVEVSLRNISSALLILIYHTKHTAFNYASNCDGFNFAFWSGFFREMVVKHC